jgi:predicted molibdopterin-dependent oxidoreductase YjgC
MDGISSRIPDHPTLGPLPAANMVKITVDGRTVAARDGEPIAAALIAAGVRVFRTMPRTGEARGGYCLVGRCSDCLMQVDGEFNVRVCVTATRNGMRVKTQHGLGEFDRGVEL